MPKNENEMRTRLLPKMTNAEAEAYLGRGDLIFVPVGTVETHGGFPLDCETVISEAFALKMAEKTDGLVLTNLPYFYAGATPVGRGTVQMSINDGIAYLDKIAHSLLNQGFRRQVYLSFHGPAYLTASPVVRQFFDDTKVPILYLDLIMAMMNQKLDLFADQSFNDMFVGGYSIMGRLEEMPLGDAYPDRESVEALKKSSAFAAPLLKLAYQSGAVGYYFADPIEHVPTPAIRTPEERLERAKNGERMIGKIVDALDLPTIVATLRELDTFVHETVLPKYGDFLPRTR